jgi:predicted transcriptional regulator
MSSVMHDVKELVNHLPDDASIEDVQYHLYVLEKIRKGQDDIENGRQCTTDKARERLNRWLKP